MSSNIFDTVEKELDIEFFLDRESIPYREGRGVNGIQFHVKTCPSCGDNRWRTYFGAETGRGNCFVCSKGFSKASFIHSHLGHDSWRDTIKVFNEILHEQGWRQVRKAVVAVLETNVTLPTSEALPLPDGSNLLYIDQRGIDPATTAYFRLRHCKFGWWKYVDMDQQTKMQDFSNRLIIPVYDLDGELKTFQGRDLIGTSDRKYLFPKMLPGTGRYLLNGQNVIATDHVVMGEGFFDVAAIKVAFDAESDLRHIVPVGSFGKHLSYGASDCDDQLGRFIQLKARGVKFVTIMWDGEEKALVSALDAAKMLTKAIGLTVRVALLPAGKDPNEITADVVRQVFREAQVWTPALDVRLRLRNPYRETHLF